MKLTSLLQQAGKINNLQQVGGIFDCVRHKTKELLNVQSFTTFQIQAQADN